MAPARLMQDVRRSMNQQASMSIRTALTPTATQPHLDDLLMGDVDLDLMFSVDSTDDDAMDGLQSHSEFLRLAAMPIGRH